VAGYTFSVLALVLLMINTMPATAVGRETPDPDATIDTTLISLVSAVAVP
jgi:hypothetical protein